MRRAFLVLAVTATLAMGLTVPGHAHPWFAVGVAPAPAIWPLGDNHSGGCSFTGKWKIDHAFGSLTVDNTSAVPANLPIPGSPQIFCGGIVPPVTATPLRTPGFIVVGSRDI